MYINPNTKFLIIGLGLMGGSYAMALSRKNYQVKAITKEQSSIDFALQHGYIQSGCTEIEPKLVREADIIVFALYPNAFIEWIEQNHQLFSAPTIITDVTGIKVPIIEKIQKMLPAGVEFIASHPMAGREVYGVENSDDRIFRNANFVLTPNQNNTKKAISTISELAEILGFSHISQLSPKEHDDIIGFVSQLTHCIAIALMNSNSTPKLEDYTGDSFRDLTRIARINDAMWSELFLLNKTELLRHIEKFEAEMDQLKLALAKDDQAYLREMMQRATEHRALFDKKD